MGVLRNNGRRLGGDLGGCGGGCCNKHHSVRKARKVQKLREKRAWKKEIQ